MVPGFDTLQRASRALRLKVRTNQASDTVEVLEASSAKRRGGLLVFIAPASGLEAGTQLALARAAHQHLPMVEARLRAMESEAKNQYVRLTRNEEGAWMCVVANVRLRRNGRVTPVPQSAVRLPSGATEPVLLQAVEVACRRARLALVELDPMVSEVLETRFIDELIASEAALLRTQLDVQL
jgi:hypothetical protein